MNHSQVGDMICGMSISGDLDSKFVVVDVAGVSLLTFISVDVGNANLAYELYHMYRPHGLTIRMVNSLAILLSGLPTTLSHSTATEVCIRMFDITDIHSRPQVDAVDAAIFNTFISLVTRDPVGSVKLDEQLIH